MNNSVHDRLKEIRANKRLNQSDFAKSLGIGQSTLAMLEVGKRDILDRHIKTICSIYEVNEDWLRTGRGEMYVQSDVFSLDEKARQHNLSELEIDIMKGYMELPPESRNDLISMFGKIYGKHNETTATTELSIDAEVESYRRELEVEKKIQRSSASDERKGKSS